MSKNHEKEKNQKDSCRWITPTENDLPPTVNPVDRNRRSSSAGTEDARSETEETSMPGTLTLTEKEHWVARFAQHIEKRVEAIAAEDPLLLERIGRESRRRALASLGLLDWQTELEAIEQQMLALEQRKRLVKRSMLAHIRGVAVEDIDDYENHRHHREVQKAVERRQAVHQDELLGESEIGQYILELRKEKENLWDAVWLATSLMQIQELWSKLTELLNVEPTPLEREALAIVTRRD